jgi:PRC-barrel domain
MDWMTTAAGYVAPAATMFAACMTAANLGPRVTGWGFVVFAVGSLAWSAIAISTGQQSLLITNGFLTLVNAVGIWRWLGRIARFDDGAKAAELKSVHAASPTLVNMGAIEGRPIVDNEGTKIGSAIGMMAAVESGTISYIVAGLGGIGGLGERLVALPWPTMSFVDGTLSLSLDENQLTSLPELDPVDWPEHHHVHEGV